MRLVRRLRSLMGSLRTLEPEWGIGGRADVVIFYATNMDYLVPLCGTAPMRVVDPESRRIHLSWGLILRVLGLMAKGTAPRTSYFAALLRELRPAIVVTFIDNSELFYDVARANEKCMRFLAIQNGARYDVVELSPKAAKRIFIPEFACFGDYEADLYRAKGATVGRFIPVGSLRESLFRRYWKDNAGRHIPIEGKDEQYDFDICVVAEASPGWNRMYPGSEDAIGDIAAYAVRFARERGLRLVIAGKRDVAPDVARAWIHLRDTEVQWYEKYVGTDVQVRPRVRDQFTTYGLISRSRVSLALMSTALREAASRGSRVLFCNFSGDERWDFCVDGIWSLTDHSYAAFAGRLETLLSMSDEAYRLESAKMSQYVMKNDDRNPTDLVLSQIIAEAVALSPGRVAAASSQ